MSNVLIRADTLTEADCISFIEQMENRFGPLHERMQKRRASFHNLEESSPLLTLKAPYQGGFAFQSDMPRKIHKLLKSRLVGNKPRVVAEPLKNLSSQKTDASNLELVMNEGNEWLQTRTKRNILARLADGIIIYGLGVAHWKLAEDIYPEVPEHDEIDEILECQMCEGTGKAAGKSCPDCGGKGYDYSALAGYDYTEDDYQSVGEGEPKQKQKQYRETSASLNQRILEGKAAAGYPWYKTTIQPDSFMFQEDESLEEGFSMCITRSTVGLLDYSTKTDNEARSLNEANKKLNIHGEVPAPIKNDPSAAQWGPTITMYQLWTRDEWYELVTGTQAAGTGGSPMGLKLVKSDKHGYGQPPFAMAVADEIDEADPVLRFEPALEGLFRMKAAYDRKVALRGIVTEILPNSSVAVRWSDGTVSRSLSYRVEMTR